MLKTVVGASQNFRLSPARPTVPFGTVGTDRCEVLEILSVTFFNKRFLQLQLTNQKVLSVVIWRKSTHKNVFRYTYIVGIVPALIGLQNSFHCALKSQRSVNV